MKRITPVYCVLLAVVWQTVGCQTTSPREAPGEDVVEAASQRDLCALPEARLPAEQLDVEPLYLNRLRADELIVCAYDGTCQSVSAATLEPGEMWSSQVDAVGAVATGDGRLVVAGAMEQTGPAETSGLEVALFDADGEPVGRWRDAEAERASEVAFVDGQILVRADDALVTLALGAQGRLEEVARRTVDASSLIAARDGTALVCTPPRCVVGDVHAPECSTAARPGWTAQGAWDGQPVVCGEQLVEPGRGSLVFRDLADGEVTRKVDLGVPTAAHGGDEPGPQSPEYCSAARPFVAAMACNEATVVAAVRQPGPGGATHLVSVELEDSKQNARKNAFGADVQALVVLPERMAVLDADGNLISRPAPGCASSGEKDVD